jgi:hypothetical protein
MSRAELDRLIDEVRALSSDEMRKLREVLDETLRVDEQAHRRELIQSVKGKYAHLGLSSDEFAASKAAEIELEDRWDNS